MDHQVKIRGFRVELGEIEACLRQCPSVTEVVVTTRTSGTEDRQMFAYILSATGERPSIETLRQFLRARLPEYMVPSVFMFVDSFPLTPHGKVDRKALPNCETERPKLDTAFAEPRGAVEKRVARIWSELLGIDSVGIHDSFFDLGGHSLLAIQLISRLRQVFHLELPVRTLFDSPTIAQLSDRIEECRQSNIDAKLARETTWIYLVPIQRSGTQRPLFLVPGGGGGEDELLVYARMARLVGEDFPFYGLQARGCDGQLEPHARVEQMATDYIREIRSCQPEGPYQLAGECLGGIVAYEIARQFIEQGQKVALLLLLDTPRPTSSRYVRHCIVRFTAAINTWKDFNAERLAMHWEKLRKMELRKRPRYLANKAFKFVLAIAYALRLKRIPDPEGEFEAVQHVRRVRAGYPRTLLRYRPKPYCGRITLIINESWDYRAQTQSWTDLAGGGMDIIQVTGTHFSYIRAHAASTAVQLRTCLEKAAGNEY
jgi:thioesterase domain-containing protein/acyl carrier protein